MSFAPAITLTDAMTDPNLFGDTFAADSFWTWRTVAKLIDGIPLTEKREIELFEACTGRTYNHHHRRAVRPRRRHGHQGRGGDGGGPHRGHRGRRAARMCAG
jgi:hypothetical protein